MEPKKSRGPAMGTLLPGGAGLRGAPLEPPRGGFSARAGPVVPRVRRTGPRKPASDPAVGATGLGRGGGGPVRLAGPPPREGGIVPPGSSPEGMSGSPQEPDPRLVGSRPGPPGVFPRADPSLRFLLRGARRDPGAPGGPSSPGGGESLRVPGSSCSRGLLGVSPGAQEFLQAWSEGGFPGRAVLLPEAAHGFLRPGGGPPERLWAEQAWREVDRFLEDLPFAEVGGR